MDRLVFAAILALAACGGPPDVAGTCAGNADCDDGLTCNTSIPMGYCTASCTTGGSTDECPEESVCDQITGGAMSCVKICKTDTDCRSDLGCNGVTGSNIKACKPKT